jgi:TRAP-type C4-dicarboxylate transport system permease small subunit
LRIFGEIVDWAAIAAGGTIITLVFVNVVLHLFASDIDWTTQLCELLMVWVTFLGGAAAGRRGEHVALSELVGWLVPGPVRLWVDGAVQLIVTGVLVSLIWYGVGIADGIRDNTMSVLGWSLAVEYSALPVGSAAALVFVLYDLYLIIRGVSREERYRLV